ncbi:MAG: hypothetical protein WKG00_10105 [Polyangiaceae bacterium]
MRARFKLRTEVNVVPPALRTKHLAWMRAPRKMRRAPGSPSRQAHGRAHSFLAEQVPRPTMPPP